jgi:autotransporter passenger strand-loop-strand repeat protein
MGLVIDISYDSSVNNAPAAFKAAVADAVAFFESWFTNPITIKIDVGYDEVDGQALGAGSLGESLIFLDSYSYSQITNALLASAMSADQTTAAGTLPSADPAGGNYWVATAEAKALGLLGASSSVDGYVGFSSSAPFTYDPNNRAVPGEYDFIGVVEHEISEVLGRILLVGATIGNTPNSYGPLDLFHYASPGVRDFVGTQAGYFSIDGGTTNLDNFNTNPNGDFGDWAATAENDSFLAFGSPGVENAVSPADLREMNILGYDFAIATVSSGETHSATGIESDLVLSGGTVVVTPTGTIIDAIVDAGGYDIISSGGTSDATTLSGIEIVVAGGTANDTAILHGGYQAIYGTANNTTVGSGGADNVLSGGGAAGTTLNSGGEEGVFSGGAARGTTIDGGIQVVGSAGIASATIVDSGHQVVLAGGVVSNTTVNGGDDLIGSGGRGYATTVNSGGLEVAEIGGTVSGSTVHGIEVVFGRASGTTVDSGGFEVVWGSGGSASGIAVDSGGFDFIVSGVDDHTVLDGGTEFVVSGGTADFTAVNSGGVQVVSAHAYSATVNGGGVQLVDSGGNASGTTVEHQGYEYVGSGGTASATTIDGGVVEVASGGSTGSAPIAFTSNGGDLQLDASVSFHGSIGGFGSPFGVTEEIDLRDVAFGSGTALSFTEAGNNLSGTLTVSDGTHTASLTLLGQYATGNFTLSSDGHRGTFITDPPLTASSPVLAAHHAWVTTDYSPRSLHKMRRDRSPTPIASP